MRVVELVALVKIKYSTVQNWYPGDVKEEGFIILSKRGLCRARGLKCGRKAAPQ